MNKMFKIAFLPFMLLLVYSCSQAPLSTSFDMTAQQKVQSVQHWNVLAEDTAEQIKLGLTAKSAMDRFVYLEKNDNTPFGEGFQNMLLTKLLNKGIRITSVKDVSVLKVSYNAQVVYHKEPLKQPKAGRLALLTAGVLVARDAIVYSWSAPAAIAAAGGALVLGDLIDNGLPDFFSVYSPNTEIILTTSVLDGNQYMIRKTDCYYVNFADSWHYNDSPTQTIKLTN